MVERGRDLTPLGRDLTEIERKRTSNQRSTLNLFHSPPLGAFKPSPEKVKLEINLYGSRKELNKLRDQNIYVEISPDR